MDATTSLRERRLRRISSLARRAGNWPISVLVSWFAVEAAARLAPDDPLPSLLESIEELVRRATDVKVAASPGMLAIAIEGLLARHQRARDDEALLKGAVDLALAYEESCRHASVAGSLGRLRSAITVPVPAARKRERKR